nr:unnamed protein product [Spirometra erinaceieuropaei]
MVKHPWSSFLRRVYVLLSYGDKENRLYLRNRRRWMLADRNHFLDRLRVKRRHVVRQCNFGQSATKCFKNHM